MPQEAQSQAQCRFFAESRPSITESRDGAWTLAVSDGACETSFNFGVRNNFSITSIAVTSRPANASVQVKGIYGFIYTAKAGFKGKDKFILKICGKSDTGTGCSNITYNVTVS